MTKLDVARLERQRDVQELKATSVFHHVAMGKPEAAFERDQGGGPGEVCDKPGSPSLLAV